MRNGYARTVRVGLALVALLGGVRCSLADPLIVENGKANARIVITQDPPRMVDLAAKELKLFVRKMTGAELPIVNEPGDKPAVTIYVGESEYTRRLGVSAEGLRHGAFRMVSGDNWPAGNASPAITAEQTSIVLPDTEGPQESGSRSNAGWLALVGGDYDFEPREPWPHSPNDIERANAEWDKITGHTWGSPMVRLYKDYHREFDIWRFDQGGSLNAVYEFLRTLGVRWYMPGELGEIVPERTSIHLPHVDRTVRPSFPLRQLKWSNYAAISWEDLIWDRRMGINSGYEVWGAKTYRSHGMRAVISRRDMQKAHPEYYALIAGRRQTDRNGTGRPCLRSEGLIRETVRYCRAVFDHYDEPMVDIWPTDGFAQCQCPLCRDIDNVSDYVWGFVARVAREVYKTHPDRKISCGAYNIYAAPPPGIDRLPPNVVVIIANRGRPGFGDPERWNTYRETVEGWRTRVAPGNIIRGENQNGSISSGGRSGPVPFPNLHPHEYARDLKYLAGICLGERNEVSRGIRRAGKEHTWRAPGLDHLNYYVNARFLWDAGQDIDAILDEYYRQFYGPAAAKMQTAFEFADAHFPCTGTAAGSGGMPPMAVRSRFVEMLLAARDAADDSIYGRRIQFIIDELPSLEQLRIAGELSEQRGEDVLTFDRLMHDDTYDELKTTFRPDGRLDEPFWQNYPHGRTLRNITPGPNLKTTFLARWVGDDIYFGIHCTENTDEPPAITTTREDDPAIFDGDRIDLLLETGPTRCYRLVVNPAGALLDEAITAGGGGLRWSSNAEVGVHVGDGYWSVELKLKTVDQTGGAMDHLNYLVGGRPTTAWPWYFNVGRVRVRNDRVHVMSYAPLDRGDLTNRTSFARLLLRGDAKRLLRSQGPADPATGTIKEQ